MEEELLEEKEKRIEELEKEVVYIYVASTTECSFISGVIW